MTVTNSICKSVFFAFRQHFYTARTLQGVYETTVERPGIHTRRRACASLWAVVRRETSGVGRRGRTAVVVM